jgi:hypothetical protein
LSGIEVVVGAAGSAVLVALRSAEVVSSVTLLITVPLTVRLK